MGPFEVPHRFVDDDGSCSVCLEEQAHAYHDETLGAVKHRIVTAAMQHQDWQGDSPFWLMCQTPADGNVGIDIDAADWIEANKPLMRSPGTWFLMAKRTGTALFSVVLDEGDQFYFAKRHVGNVMTAREIVAYGIGKKKADGVPVNLWMLPNGVVCGGDDVDTLGARVLSAVT